MQILYAPTADDIMAVAQQALTIAAGRRKWMLYGGMGAGKTTFVAALCRILGVQDMVSSPTFALIQEYAWSEAGLPSLVRHIDLYRLESLSEALDIGIEDYLYDPSLTLIEWPERIEALLPPDFFQIRIEIESDSSRKFVFL